MSYVLLIVICLTYPQALCEYQRALALNPCLDAAKAGLESLARLEKTDDTGPGGADVDGYRATLIPQPPPLTPQPYTLHARAPGVGSRLCVAWVDVCYGLCGDMYYGLCVICGDMCYMW
jgi:hypothetical protein